jgi:hypothetical protein
MFTSGRGWYEEQTFMVPAQAYEMLERYLATESMHGERRTCSFILAGRRGSCRIGGGRGTGYVNNTPAATVAKLDNDLEVIRARRRCQQS